MEFIMKHTSSGLLLGVLMAISLPALAEHRDRFGDSRRDGHWQGRDIHRFAEHDLGTWRGGHWRHGHHGGRMGWWWVAAGIWYFYPEPVYPYPDPYMPPVTVINQQPQVVAPQPSAPIQPQQTPQVWYYCDSAKSYYPYVPSCPEGWKTVPAHPPQPAPH
jgi:hypothetical protein